MRFSLDGRVQFREELNGKWTDTIITRVDIERFFEKASLVGKSEDLGPRPAMQDLLEKKANYSDCSYCPLKDTCDKYEKQGYTKWIQEVNKLAKVLRK